MIGYPLDSKVEYDSEGRPTYDRAITSKPLRKLYSQLFSTGVMPNPSNNFQVIAGDAGMTVKVNPGFAVVQGCLKLEETTRTIEIQAASSSLDRIDTVVLRLNDEVNARICDLYVRQGIPASSPTRPDLVRSGSVYEIGLADIFIPANTATIVQKRITDTRLDPDRCGYVSSISKFDTETLYLQIQNDLADFKLNEQAEFLEWFEYIKVQLSEDVAGNLQNQIGVLLNLKTEIKTDLVNAINWLKENIDTLNSNFTVNTYVIELPSDWFGVCFLYEYGNIGAIIFNAYCTNTLTDGISFPLFSLNSHGFSKYSNAVFRNNGANTTTIFAYLENGNFYLNPHGGNAESNNYIRGTLVVFK